MRRGAGDRGAGAGRRGVPRPAAADRATRIPIAPHVAVARTPWAGPVAVYSASDDFGYRVRPRDAAAGGDRRRCSIRCRRARRGCGCGAAVRVRLGSGSLQSRSEAEVLNGANAAALRFGIGGRLGGHPVPRRASWWRRGEYRLSGLLRGQAGTDAVMPEAWPAGTDFVLLDGAVEAGAPAGVGARAASGTIGSGRRSGPTTTRATFIASRRSTGVGLRPYRPVHLRARRGGRTAASS